MTLDTPYQSQIPYETGGEGERRWCGLTCLQMVISYYLKENVPSLNYLIEKYGSWLEQNGFQHKDFLKIARDFGLKGFRKSWWVEPGVTPIINKFRTEGESEEEISAWMDTNVDEGIFTIKKCIDNSQPVIVSVDKRFSPSLTSHLIVVIGNEDNNLIIHDPLHRGANFEITENDFKKYWLRQAMIIYK